MRRIVALILFSLAGFALYSVTHAQGSMPTDEERLSKLDSIIGREVFACYEASFYHYDLAQRGADKPLKVVFGEKAIVYPLLTGLKISNAVVVGKTDDVLTIALIVRYQDSKSLVAIVHLMRKGKVLEGDDLFAELLREHKGYIFGEVPKSFSEEAIDSIRTYGVSKGMTSTELVCALGWPEARNDYGKAGKQWVYRHGKLLIYLDAEDETVKDVQTFE